MHNILTENRVNVSGILQQNVARYRFSLPLLHHPTCPFSSSTNNTLQYLIIVCVCTRMHTRTRLCTQRPLSQFLSPGDWLNYHLQFLDKILEELAPSVGWEKVTESLPAGFVPLCKTRTRSLPVSRHYYLWCIFPLHFKSVCEQLGVQSWIFFKNLHLLWSWSRSGWKRYRSFVGKNIKTCQK